MNRTFACSLGVLLGTFATGCSSDPPAAPPPDFEATVLAMSDEAILPAAASFSVAAAELDEAIVALCSSQGGMAPDEAGVETARTRWRNASTVWNRFVVYDFGPMADGIPTPAGAFIDSFKAFGQGESHAATVRSELNTFVMDGADLSGEDFSSWTYTRVGLLALEVALFETSADPAETGADAVATELASSVTKCSYLTQQSALLARRAEDLNNAWLPEGEDHRATFLASTNDALGAVLSSIHGHLEYLDKRSIANRGAPVSGISYDNIAASLQEVERLLQAGEGDGLAGRLGEARAQDVLDEHAALLVSSRAAVQAEDPDALGPHLIDLANLHKTDIPQALGIELGLNFTDGD